MNTANVQKALKKLGFYTSTVDGFRGRGTINAIKAFQREYGLTDDGIVGPITATKLMTMSDDDVINQVTLDPWYDMPWLAEAYRLMGTKEDPTEASSETIMGWARDRNLTYYTGDDIAWCGLFIAHTMGSQLPEEKLPENVLGARQWINFGKSCTPGRGAVMVFWRGRPNSIHGHVGYYWAEDDRYYYILGGNQSNEVNISAILKTRLLGARYPVSIKSNDPIAHLVTGGAQVTTNEA